MSKPVLVVHGINNHDRAAFERQVDALQNAIRTPLPNVSLIPVYWGDLGGQSASIVDCLPQLNDGQWTTRAEAIISMRSPGLAVRSTVSMTNDERAAIIVGAAPTSAVRGGRAADADALVDALETTKYLQQIDDPETLRAVGEILGEVLSGTPGGEEGQFAVRGGREVETRGWIKDKIGSAVSAIDRLVGRVIEDRLGVLTQKLRASLMEGVAATLGDVIAYEANRKAVQQRLFDSLNQLAPGFGTEDNPIGVIAHSLGGVISFDTAVAPAAGVPLYIDSLVTFGSQSAFFEIIKPGNPKWPYRTGRPVTLPPTIREWFNLWDVVDILAFTAGTVFRLSDGRIPEDIPVQDPISSMLDAKLWLHSIYWKTSQLTDVVARAFR